jgi:D-3-phosphoglycerate dehydrogenase
MKEMSDRFSFPKSKIKVLLLENIHPRAAQQFEQGGFSLETLPSSLSEADLTERLSDVHILGIRSKTQITAKALEKAEKLMSIGAFCIGTNQIDLEECRLKGVPVFNAPFSNTRSVAEMILGEIVMLARQLGDRSREVHQGTWKKVSQGCYEVRGKTLGIVGYGHIGSQVSVLAESFGMKVIYHDIVTKMPMGNSRQMRNLQEVLEVSDFVTLHVPETPQTKKMIGESQLKMMKKGSYLLNASRGTVVCLDSLTQALKSGYLAGAAVDVYPEEPQGQTNDFKTAIQGLSNVVLTPHIGGSTEEAQENIGLEVSGALLKFVNNGSSYGSVNFPSVDLPVLEGSHRILNVHKNVPGVLKNINGILSDLGANIQGQYLATDPEIGYLIVDLDTKVSDQVKERLRALPTSLRTRVLY